MRHPIPAAGWAWVGFRAAYLIAHHADRMMRTVMRVSVQAATRWDAIDGHMGTTIGGELGPGPVCVPGLQRETGQLRP
jgi:hypothetical protein